MRSFRAYVVVFCLIWLIPANLLLSRTSSTDTAILGRYTLRYFLILVVYWLIPVALLAFAFLIARPLHINAFARPFRWLQRFPAVFVVLTLGLIEVWYYVRVILYETRFWGIGAAYQQFVVFMTLFEIYLLVFLFFFGREGEDLRDAAMNVGLLLTSLSFAFIMFSFGYAWIIKGNVYKAHREFNVIFNQPDPVLGLKLAPNLVDAKVYFEEEDDYATLSTDANGFRNPDDMTGAPMAVIGDSFIFGMFANDEDLWSTVMTQELDMPVANYAVPGYQLWQYNALAKNYVGPDQPEVVVYGIFANDLRLEEDEESETLVLQRREVWPYLSPIHFTISNFLDKSPVTKLIERLSPDEQIDSTDFTLEEDIPQLPYDLQPMCVPWALMYQGTEAENQRIAEHLSEAIRLSEVYDYQLVFVTIPSKETVYAEELLPYCDSAAESVIYKEQAGYQFICDYVESQGHLCYDMRDDFRAAADEQGLLYFRVDGHWNPEGHQVFVNLLIDYLDEHHILDSLPTGQ